MQVNFWALAGLVLVAVVTFLLGYRSSKMAISTHDFLVARRTVRSRRNAAAISGEYLSAASFLGVAGIVLKEGADALWYPIGFTAGYLAVMLFVAAPLRRSGAYSLPDFVDVRLPSRSLRKLASSFVVLIGIFYLVPQFQGAGTVLAAILPIPEWLGACLVAVVIVLNVVAGGMRAITVVQAFQYWLKLFAIAVPTFVLCTVFLFSEQMNTSTGLSTSVPPVFSADTKVDIQTDVDLQVGSMTSVRIEVPGMAGERTVVWPAGEVLPFEAGSVLHFAGGTPVPVVAGTPATNADWLLPHADGPLGLLGTYSLIFATFLGVMGLPHVLARFYTNPDGKAARRTAGHVLLLLGLFYLFPILLGALSRLYLPGLLVTGDTDAAVMLLPSAVLPGWSGHIVGAVLAAGAFSAFVATSSGLLVSISGVVTTDALRSRTKDVRLATAAVALVPLLLALLMPADDLVVSIGLCFALAASTFCPLLLMGIWWRRFTKYGAIAGMLVGGGLVLVAITLNVISRFTGGWAPWFCQQPALFSVPAAFFAAFLVSLATPAGVPDNVSAAMLRLHAPDPLGFMRDRQMARLGRAEEKVRLAEGRHRKQP